MDGNLRVGFCGAAGSGRTFAAEQVSKELALPLILSHSITRPILERDSYDYSKGYVEHFLGPRQLELIKCRLESEAAHKSFITDRTVLDQFAYLLLGLHHFDAADVLKMEKTCRAHMKSYTHLFYFPRPEKINKNGVRTDNMLFQSMVDYVIRGLIEDWGVAVVKLNDSAKILEIIRPAVGQPM